MLVTGYYFRYFHTFMNNTEMAYCVLCQEGHEMTDNCMKYVVCKECGEMGHLSIKCSKV